MDDERFIMAINESGEKAQVGIACEKRNAKGEYEEIGSLKGEINEKARIAIITKGIDNGGYKKCHTKFCEIAEDLKVSIIIDEREKLKKQSQQVIIRQK